MTEKILIDSGPSSRGWLHDALGEITLTGAFGFIDTLNEVLGLFGELDKLYLPEGVCRIPLTQGKWALVDQGDFDWLVRQEWCACRRKDGSWVAARGGAGAELMHRAIARRAGFPPRKLVDHVNGDTLDNRRSNLRPANHSQNGANSKRKGKQPHGFRGIYHDSSTRCRKKWTATIKVNRKSKYLGRFATPEEAARAYDAAAVKHFGAFARLNFTLERR